MLPYTGDYIEHIDSTTNYFRYYTFAPRPLMNGNMYQMDDELATLLTEAHRNIGFLEGLIQFAPNRDPFTELIPVAKRSSRTATSRRLARYSYVASFFEANC